MEVVEDSEKSDEISTPTDPNVSLFAYLLVVLQNLSIATLAGFQVISNSLKLTSVIKKIYCRCVCMSVFWVLKTKQ